MPDPIEALREHLGATKLAEKLNERRPDAVLTPQAISQWKKVPPARVLDVEAVTGVSRHDLRPDLFGPAPKAGAAA